ncbi:MAG: outer membrane lipoprotein chaperone LolA, partial [Comamonas sp.]
MKKSLGVVALWGMLPLAVWADGLQSLENFMRTAQAGQAQFTQTVTSPAKEGQPARTKNSSGEFAFQRPGQFKFFYQKPFEQTIVADGQTVWLYDVDLNQVTQRRQADALGSTPAAILASAHDLSGLQKDFTLKAAPDADGLQWVEATPKSPDGQLKSVRVGFAGDTLTAMDILDGFGQRSVIRFHDLRVLP